MDIWELESQTGLSRANIRYYEKEGIITFDSNERGEQIYHEADISSLRKIFLLRQLRFSLDEIKQLQSNEESTLAELKHRLSSIHPQMLVDNITYDSFDEMAFLALLTTKSNIGRHRENVLYQDMMETVPHPWRRYFARVCDIGLYQLLWLTIRLFVFRQPPAASNIENIIYQWIPVVVCLLFEPYLLTLFGTTFGKWVMGIHVRSNLGYPSFRQARKRTWHLFAYGLGYYIPFYSAFVMYRNYKECANHKMLVWDDETYLVLKDKKKHRMYAMFFLETAQLFAVVWLIMQSYLPIYRGLLTPAKYFANVNDAMRQENYSNGFVLSDIGDWIDDPNDESIAGYRSSLPKHELILQDDVVIGVQLKTISSDKFVIVDHAQRLFAFRALVGANKSVKARDLLSHEILTSLENPESFKEEFHGMRIENKTVIVGYDLADSFLIARQDEKNPSYQGVFEIRYLQP